MNPTCLSCRWWVLDASAPRRDGLRVGDCRRRSPAQYRARDGQMLATFPQTSEDMFCGQHEEFGK
jgi:hypothetical protein